MESSNLDPDNRSGHVWGWKQNWPGSHGAQARKCYDEGMC